MMDSCTSDYIEILATTMNASALNDAMIQTGIEMRQIAEFYIRNRAIKHIGEGRVVIFECGNRLSILFNKYSSFPKNS